MLKKLVVGTLTMGIVAGFVFGSDSFSYLRTFGKNVRQAVKSEITPEFEIGRIRNDVDNLMPEIRRHMTIVAEQSVDVKDLEQEIAARETGLVRQKEAILALRTDLQSEKDKFTYKAVSYSRREVEADLQHRFQSFRTAEESLMRDRQILTAQRETLRANQQKLDTMLSRKQELVVRVAQLEARLKQVQAREAVNSVEIDDSRLAHVEGLIKDMNRELDIRESLLETEGHTLGRIPVEDAGVAVNPDILSEIDSHFGAPSDEAEKSSSSDNNAI